jgi:hypothetical protein
MPRGPGIGNADTVQQRARFFGYKRRYLGFCRIYLEQDVLTAFQAYVEHEEFMRTQLQSIQRSGQPLSTWKRAFVLSPDLQPCRRNVLQYDYVHGNYSDQWYYPAIALAPGAVVNANRDAVQKFIATLQLAPVEEHREAAQRHSVARNVMLAEAISELIIPFRVTGDRSNAAAFASTTTESRRTLYRPPDKPRLSTPTCRETNGANQRVVSRPD